MQRNVNYWTDDKDIVVVCGSDSEVNTSSEVYTLAVGHMKYLLKDVNSFRDSYFSLGFHLYEFEKFGYYKALGFSSLSDFAVSNLGMESSAVSRCLHVFKTFSRHNDDSFVLTRFIQDRFSEFSYSQLVEMSTIKERKLLDSVEPSMSVRQIRELKKNVSQKKEDVSHIATSQNLLCSNDVHNLHGAALYSKIKNCESIDCKHFSLYSSDGKPIFKDLTCDILLSDDNRIIFRVVSGDVNSDSWVSEYSGNS